MGNNIYHFIISYQDITKEYMRPDTTHSIQNETVHTFRPIDPPPLTLPPQQRRQTPTLSPIPEEQTPMLSYTSQSTSPDSFSE